MTSKHIVKATLASFFTLFTSTLFLIGFSYGGSYAYSIAFPPTFLFESSAKVGNISIGDQTIEEATKIVTTKVKDWGNKSTVSFLYKENSSKSSVVDLVSFNLEESLQQAKANKTSELIVTINESVINHMLTNLSSDPLLEKVDQERLYNDLQAFSQGLAVGDLKINIHDYIVEDTKAAVSKVYITNFAFSKTLQQVADKLDGMVIESRQTSSLLKAMSLGANIHQYEMNVIATGVYSAILGTNFQITERHISQSLPEYSQLGFEASVSYPNSDLQFFNPNYTPYTLEVKATSNSIYIAVVGSPLEKRYEIEKVREQSIPPKMIIQFSSTVPKGELIVKNPGQSGFTVQVLRKAYDKNNRLLQTEEISEDFYTPIHRVELRNPIDKDKVNPSENQEDDKFEFDQNGVPIKGY